jgi:hypothetical protein
MSVLTGRTYSTLLVSRTGLGMGYAAFMDRESRAILRDQLLLTWDLSPRALLQQLKTRDPDLAVTRELIATLEPAIVLEMESRLETLR